MKIQQYYLACLSHASYMITDETTKTAVVVDPQRDIDQYLADAKAGGYAIKHVFLTHFHADFLAGHIELRDKAGATIRLGRRAEAEFPCVKMKDGDVLAFGDVKLEIMETPGHTPEGISILVYDLTKSPTEPLAVPPDYFVHDAILNRKERASLGAAMEKTMRPLSLDEILTLGKSGAQLLDVRDGIDFEGGHLKGTLNIALSGKYATWAGSMLSHDDPIVVIAEEGGPRGDDAPPTEAVMRLGRIGFDNVAGYLAGGMNALAAREDLVERTERITAPALAEWLAGTRPDAGAAPTVVDVRSEAEHAGGHIEGSLNIPLTHLEERFGEIPTGRPVAVHCEGGYRSAIAASLLQKLGRRDVHDVVGGYKAWLATRNTIGPTISRER